MLSAAVGATVVAVGTSIIFQGNIKAAAPECSITAPQPQISVHWTADSSASNRVAVEVDGLSAAALEKLRQSNWTLSQWHLLLSVYVQQGEPTTIPNIPPMLGAYRVLSGALRFEPQFPLEPGVNYRAIFWPQRLPGGNVTGTSSISSVFQLPPRKSVPTTVVSRVYPSAAVLPENLLKFYIHFSAPMSRGQIYDHIALRDESGKAIELPFLEIDEELWDPTMTRLTLFIDPGRIKRGVRPLEEIGPALEAGKQYTLVIDRGWKDGAGDQLQETFQKAFKVGPPDRDPPDPTRWQIRPPKADTRDSLSIVFPKPMDHAIAQRVIRVTADSGELVNGTTMLDDHERRWNFSPAGPWRRGAYRLVIETTLEDLAGNSIGKPFDVDLFEPIQRRQQTPTIKMSFEAR